MKGIRKPWVYSSERKTIFGFLREITSWNPTENTKQNIPEVNLHVVSSDDSHKSAWTHELQNYSHAKSVNLGLKLHSTCSKIGNQLGLSQLYRPTKNWLLPIMHPHQSALLLLSNRCQVRAKNILPVRSYGWKIFSAFLRVKFSCS